MSESDAAATVREKYRAFLAGTRRVFVHRFGGPDDRTNFCICDSSVHGPLELALRHLRYGILLFAYALPWSWPKVAVLRAFGARIGRGVYISQRAFIDPLYPELLEIGDDVLIGYDAKIFFHEITKAAFRLGRVRLERGCLVGAGAILRPGVTIGEDAEVGALSAVTHSVLPRTAVFGVPAVRIGRPARGREDEA